MEEKKGIILDLGCGNQKQEPFGKRVVVGIDKKYREGVDIVHDLEVFPWPLEDEVAITVICAHFLEHIKPWLTLEFMDEIWRVTKFGGRLAIVSPYGVSHAYVQDPTHCNPINESFHHYFDPEHELYRFYEPKPWKCVVGFPVWNAHGTIEYLMEKVK